MSDLREQLAAIEHERWADWQRWMHSQGVWFHDGSLHIPASLMERWDRQIATPYADLSEDEKQSDREQVDRYWPLIVADIGAQQAWVTRLIEYADHLPGCAHCSCGLDELLEAIPNHLHPPEPEPPPPMTEAEQVAMKERFDEHRRQMEERYPEFDDDNPFSLDDIAKMKRWSSNEYPTMRWLMTWDAQAGRIAALEAAARAAVEGKVVEAVYTSYDYDYCMACERTLENGHDADCPIGTLAALLGGEA